MLDWTTGQGGPVVPIAPSVDWTSAILAAKARGLSEVAVELFFDWTGFAPAWQLWDPDLVVTAPSLADAPDVDTATGPAPLPPGASGAPEPSTLVLAALGLPALWRACRGRSPRERRRAAAGG